MRRSLLALTVAVAAVAAAASLGIAWEAKADKVCRVKAPASTAGYVVRWEWDEFAYVCDYRAPEANERRVGLVDAFHGDGAQRHR